MEVQDLRRNRQAAEALTAAVEGGAPHATHRELVTRGDLLEGIGGTLTSMATAARGVTSTGDGAPAADRLSHPLRRVDR